MTSRSHLPAVLVVLLALLGACSQDSSDPGGSSVPGKNAPDTGNPGDAAGKPGKDSQGGSATTREQFMPILTRAHAKVTWPPSYTMSPDRLWDFMAAGAADTAYVETDATNMVTIWNTCAWTLQLIDDTRAGRPVDRDVASLTALGDGPGGEVVDRIVSDARLGELGTARQFVTANGCEKGFGN
jgi:hypothetical protein